MRTLRALTLSLALLCGAATSAAAQQQPAFPLEDFVQQVAWLWSMGDVAALVDLLPPRERVVLDTGSGTEAVSQRHAAAALRALFDSRESAGARAVQATLSGGDPPRGFGQLVWTFRPRGGPVPQVRSVYVGAIHEGNAWRITELRVMR